MSNVVILNKELMMTLIFLWHQLGDSFLLTLVTCCFIPLVNSRHAKPDRRKATFSLAGHHFVSCQHACLSSVVVSVPDQESAGLGSNPGLGSWRPGSYTVPMSG